MLSCVHAGSVFEKIPPILGGIAIFNGGIYSHQQVKPMKPFSSLLMTVAYTRSKPAFYAVFFVIRLPSSFW
jgi:hypothetical protein